MAGEVSTANVEPKVPIVSYMWGSKISYFVDMLSLGLNLQLTLLKPTIALREQTVKWRSIRTWRQRRRQIEFRRVHPR